MPSQKKQRKQQKGGSDWAQSFYSYYMSPAELSRYTLKRIDESPMFNPLEFNTVIPTGTSGIIPTGVFLARHPSSKLACAGEEEMVGGATDHSFNHPASYPGKKPVGGRAEYIGVSCGPSGEGCGLRGPGKMQPYKTDKNGRLKRCKVHYTATSSAGTGCEICAADPKPSIWSSAFPNPSQCGSKCGSCQLY